VDSTIRTSRLEANASQIMKAMSITAVNEMKDPMEDTVFHIV